MENLDETLTTEEQRIQAMLSHARLVRRAIMGLIHESTGEAQEELWALHGGMSAIIEVATMDADEPFLNIVKH